MMLQGRCGICGCAPVRYLADWAFRAERVTLQLHLCAECWRLLQAKNGAALQRRHAESRQ